MLRLLYSYVVLGYGTGLGHGDRLSFLFHYMTANKPFPSSCWCPILPALCNP